MDSLAFKIIAGYFGVGLLIFFLTVFTGYLDLEFKIYRPNTLRTYLKQISLCFLCYLIFWPVLGMLMVSDYIDRRLKKAREVREWIRYHQLYSQTSDEAKVKRLFKIYRTFKQYRPRAREEKILRAAAEVYFEVMRWNDLQRQSALDIIGPRIGKTILDEKDLAKAILTLKKPPMGGLSDAGFDEELKNNTEAKRTIEKVIQERSSNVVNLFYRDGDDLWWEKKCHF